MERMDKLLGQFEIDIRRVALRDKQKPHRTIKVEIRREISGLMRGLESPANGSSWISGYVQGEKQHDWIERMEEFRSALRGIHDEFALAELEEPPRVNVGFHLFSISSFNILVLCAC